VLTLALSIVIVGAGAVVLVAHLKFRVDVVVLSVSSEVLVGVLIGVHELMFMLLVVLSILVVSLVVLAVLSECFSFKMIRFTFIINSFNI
jgi:hypothetical protein